MQEGRQASLAADFSITRFKHVGRLLMVHGRSSYKRSAALGQFVMHRGLIISTMQVRLAPPHSAPPPPAPACQEGGGPWLLGCVICVIALFLQAVFSSVFYFASVPLYQGFLMVG